MFRRIDTRDLLLAGIVVLGLTLLVAELILALDRARMARQFDPDRFMQDVRDYIDRERPE